MAKRIGVRTLTESEAETIKARARSRTEAARDVERAQIIWLSHEGQSVPAIAAQLQLSQPTVRMWLKRFNANGLAGLSDEPRAGRPATYAPEEVGAVIAAALT